MTKTDPTDATEDTATEDTDLVDPAIWDQMVAWLKAQKPDLSFQPDDLPNFLDD